MVMERSSHGFLVGEGAKQFAKQNGISIVNNELLQTESSAKAFKVFAVIKSHTDEQFICDKLLYKFVFPYMVNNFSLTCWFSCVHVGKKLTIFLDTEKQHNVCHCAIC